MDIVHIAVVGAGTMGNGIAQVFAQAGYTVTMVDVAQAQIDRGLANIQKNLARSVEKGRITAEDKDAALGRITASLSLDDAATANLVVEAVVENARVKAEVFKHLDAICHDETILASNTSSISITAIAANTRRPEKVIGMHFFNPVPVMKLVEIVRGLATEDSTFKAVVELAEKLGKTPVEVNDYPGFVSNRLLMPMINEAAYALMEGVATREAIDTVMKLGMNHPMGPLELADLIGLDTCLHIMEALQEGFADSKYRPCPLLRKMVAAGYLGMKTGKGFYEYPRT
ncbi:MAG: 3-hydroxybutyryl-CoA dehydrogenase [Chloroflexi bacterium]|nr:3-hydroxybutyryl-CoA dehydrogenase [Chloroflexota bacterium]